MSDPYHYIRILATTIHTPDIALNQVQVRSKLKATTGVGLEFKES